MQLISLGSGKCSTFGGPSDTGIGVQEGLSCIDPIDLNEWWFRRLFLSPGSFDNSKGFARNLDPNAFYCACRWGYGAFEGVRGEILQQYGREQVRRAVIVVEANGHTCYCQASDWGPNTNTGRLIDLSPGTVKRLLVATDDIVEVSVLI